MPERSAFPKLPVFDANGVAVQTGDDGISAHELVTAIITAGMLTRGYQPDDARTASLASTLAATILTPKP